MTVSGTKTRGIREFFGRKKSTYGLILPEELEARAQSQSQTHRIRSRRRHNAQDCFVPSDLDRWELPQYESLFNHLITQDGTFRRRLSSGDPANLTSNHHNRNNTRENSHDDSSSATEDGGEGSGGPLKTVQKWFREIVKSVTHHSGEFDLGGDLEQEGVPVDMCEKLRYVHIYY